MVQVAGHAYLLPARAVKGEVDRGSLVPHMLLRCVQAPIAQTANTPMCNWHRRSVIQQAEPCHAAGGLEPVQGQYAFVPLITSRAVRARTFRSSSNDQFSM